MIIEWLRASSGGRKAIGQVEYWTDASIYCLAWKCTDFDIRREKLFYDDSKKKKESKRKRKENEQKQPSINDCGIRQRSRSSRFAVFYDFYCQALSIQRSTMNFNFR